MNPSSRFFPARKMHILAAWLTALPLAVVIATGLLLQLKKVSPWIQPPAQLGKPGDPQLTFEVMLRALRSVPLAKIESWSDVARLEVHIDRRIVKARSLNSWEIQLDAVTGEILSSAYRRSDLIESLHDGSMFGELIKYGVFLPAGCLLMVLWLTGVWLIMAPWVRRICAKRA